DLLELARVGVDLPDPLDGRRELRGDRQGEVVDVLADVGDRHGYSLLSRSSMAATRPRQTSSSSVSIEATERTASTWPLASCSRPSRRLEIRPALSSTATCFCTAAKLMSYLAASAVTECSPASTRRRMSRRVRS